MVNQYQVLLLIPLLDLYIPKNIRDFIVGNDVTLFSFSSLSFQDVSFVSSMKNDLGGKQQNEYLNEIGVESHSVIINHINLILVYLIVFLLHMSVGLISRLIRLKENNKQSK